MDFRQKLTLALVYRGMSQADLARKIGISPQNLSYKLKTARMSESDLEMIAEAIGCKIEQVFTFDMGDGVTF